MTSEGEPEGSSRPALIAAAAMPVLPVTNGYSLRASHLLRALSEAWRITLVAPLGAGSVDALRGLGIQDVVPMPLFRGWDAPLSDAERRSVHETVNNVVARESAQAAIVWAGAETVLLDNPRFPPTVIDRLDSEVVIAWNEMRDARNLTGRLRAIRNALVWSRQERRLVRAASSVLVDSPGDARVLRVLGGRNVRIIANAVAIQPPATADEEARVPTVVLTGSLSYSANVRGAQWFAELVWPAVRARVRGARLILAGRDPGAEIMALGSLDGVEIAGDVADMRTVLRGAWVAISPVRTGAGIRTKVLEAWAVGRPVVQSPVSASGLRLDPDAASLVASSPARTAALVTRLLEDPAERRRLGASAHALATREYGSWEARRDTISDLLRAAMGTPR